MKILITGATGFLGRQLVEKLIDRGDQITAITRNTSSRSSKELAALKNVTVVSWDGPPSLTELVSQSDAIFNLAGEPVIGKRWSPQQKQVLHDSRVKITRSIFDAIAAASHRPRVVISASAIGYYGFTKDEELTESDGPGDDFLAKLCSDWEAAARHPGVADVRTVIARIGVVLGNDGGALEQMARPFKLFGGGPIGDGSQWLSWIHIDDVMGLLLFALDHQNINGVLNLTAPAPMTNRDFSKLLGRVLHRPSWLPVPKFALKVAFGEVASVLASGQRVLPKAALDLGYRFQHPQPEEALRSLLG